MVQGAEDHGFDVDEKALGVWETASVFLKHYLVHRGRLFSPHWPPQDPGTSRCSAVVMARVLEFQELNHGWIGSFEVKPGGEWRDEGDAQSTRRENIQSLGYQLFSKGTISSGQELRQQ